MRSRWHGMPRGRPPWWPENEPFPPEDGRRWRGMRGHFMRRVALLFLTVALLAVLALTLVAWLVASALGPLEVSGTLGRAALLVGAALGAIALALAAGGMRRVAAPIGDLIEAAGRVESGDYAARVAERGTREVRALARSFNAMAARLEGSEDQRRRLLADVTHELRGPLAVAQGNLEALLDGMYPADPAHLEPIGESLRVLSRLVDDLRTLSLAEAGALALHRERTDLASLARDTVATFGAHAHASGIALELDAADALVADVDPVRAREVLANLIANALRYTPAGGTVRVRVEAASERVAIAVRDSGAGIAPEALPHVFDRFYKSAESRGAGLGLAIAKSLVVAHGGDITATSEPGRGTEIRFALPLAAAGELLP